MKKLALLVSLFIIVGCGQSEFDRCVEANIEIIRESPEPESLNLPIITMNLEARLSIKVFEETMKPFGFDNEILSLFKKSLDKPKNRSNTLAYFSLLMNETNLQINLENHENTYVTFLGSQDQEVFEEYHAQEVIYKLNSYGICPPEVIYDDCSYRDSFSEKAYYYRMNYQRSDYLYFETEQEFLNHFKKNISWTEYNSFINTLPTFTLNDILNFYNFNSIFKSTLMNSTDDELYPVAKNVCNLQGIY